MKKYKLTAEQITSYGQYLLAEERSSGTIEKYLRDIKLFVVWKDGRSVTKELATDWKNYLTAQGYAPVTINAMLSALNGLFKFLGWDECCVKFLRIQRRLFRDTDRELNRSEYNRLISAAKKHGRERLVLLMETLCATGIRVSEVKYITVETARRGRADISLKGKIRVILLPTKLCRKLLKYAKKQKTASGAIFRTRNGKDIGRRQIWAELKSLCKHAGVEQTKVFPHNLRHLFAKTFYKAFRDIACLADVLGHSSIDTTRIYLVTSGAEHRKQLNRLELVL